MIISDLIFLYMYVSALILQREKCILHSMLSHSTSLHTDIQEPHFLIHSLVFLPSLKLDFKSSCRWESCCEFMGYFCSQSTLLQLV